MDLKQFLWSQIEYKQNKKLSYTHKAILTKGVKSLETTSGSVRDTMASVLLVVLPSDDTE